MWRADACTTSSLVARGRLRPAPAKPPGHRLADNLLDERAADGRGFSGSCCPPECVRAPASSSAVARATMRSSSAGTMKMAAFERAADRRASPLAPAFSAGSSDEAQVVEPCADGSADRRALLADPAREGEHVHAAEGHQAGAQVVADRVDEDIEGEPRAGVASGGRLLQVADVSAQAADAREARPARQQVRHRVGVEPSLLHHEQRGEHVEVADAVVLRQARLRRQAEAGFDGDSVADRRRRSNCLRGGRKRDGPGGPRSACARSEAARWLAPWNP